MNKSILVIEDEEDIRDILTHYIKKEGYIIKEAMDGEMGIRLVETESIDLIILDLMLPHMSGFDVCKKISSNHKISIIMLTAKCDIVDKILGLELGADDYITKPFDIREVMTRIKVCLRRIENLKDEDAENVIKLSQDIRILENSREVFKGEEGIRLKPREFDLLLAFAKNRKVVMSRDKLLQKVWGYDFEGDSRTVDVHVQRLRKKLEESSQEAIIQTVFGVGYKMI